LRNRHVFASDAVLLVVSALVAFAVRFESFEWIGDNLALVLPYVVVSVPLRLLLLYATGMYRRLWRHASVGELRHSLAVAAFAALLSAIVGVALLPLLRLTPTRLPLSVLFIDGILSCAAIGLPRLLARTVRRPATRRRRSDPGKPALIIGAGDTAKRIVKELLANPALGFEPIGFVDDDASMHKKVLLNLPIFGPLSMIKKLVEHHNITELILAMPSAHGDVVRSVVRVGLDCGIPTLTVPSLPELISRGGNSSTLREIQIEDLLRRAPVETDMASIAALATAETVLVTGAGGSIGSELCRQVARLAPSTIVLLGHGENSIFDILNELKLDYPDVRFIPVIADVRDRARVISVVAKHRPRAIFHAAAHKHVPLMEENVVEAVTNNVIGTRNIVDAAVEAQTEHFVLISTDKAVRPTSVMGASKRVAELIVQHAALKHNRNFVSVRFGNVLGSRGSVVPTFLRQIRAGGPVTVTHPEMRRFFMTIPEAVQLVLQAGALGRGGEVFLLDMGEPIKVVDLALDLIRLSGLPGGADIEGKFTGMRPGEKLYEEMFFTGEAVIPTEHPKILRARNGILPDSVVRRMDTLVHATTVRSTEEEIRALLRSLVPDFHTHPAPPPIRGDEGQMDEPVKRGRLAGVNSAEAIER
jgi:FlaA1/EpsC-like NDP-sugar epimerase